MRILFAQVTHPHLLHYKRSYKMYKLHRSELDQKINTVHKIDGQWLLSIPFDPDNTDYQAFLLWCDEGNQPLPAETN